MQGRKGTIALDPKNINLSQGLSIYGDAHILFRFTSHESIVKQIVRELLWGGVISNGKYQPEDDPYSSRKVSYYVYIENNNFDDLVKMFWYRNKIMQRIFPGIRSEEKCDEEDSYLVTFRKVKVSVTYQKNGEWITASVAQLLQDAYLTANKMQDTELVINEQNKPDDLSLWTEEELLADKETVKKLENKTQLDKLYVRENYSSSAEPSSPHLKRGINEVDEEGKTYLHAIFCNREFVNAVKFLLDKGADVNRVNGEGNTPLHLVMKQYQEILTLLLTHGADLQKENLLGVKPIDLLSDWIKTKNGKINEKMQKNPFKFWQELEKESSKSYSKSFSELNANVKKGMGKQF